MGGVEVDARPVARRGWRVLLGALVALALLTPGVGEALPRALAAAQSGAASTAADATGDPVVQTAERGAPTAERTSMEAPAPDLVVRGAPMAVVPAPTGPVSGLLPGGAPLVAPHLVAQPQARPPTDPLAATAPGAPGSRGPPATTGT